MSVPTYWYVKVTSYPESITLTLYIQGTDAQGERERIRDALKPALENMGWVNPMILVSKSSPTKRQAQKFKPVEDCLSTNL